MTKQIFINLPVRDLAQATAFYGAIGAEQNPQFSDDSSACMVLSEAIFVMLMTHEKWATFTSKPIADARQQSEAMFALSADSRAAIDAMLEAVGAHGGAPDVNPKQDLGFMYNRSFQDPDGHIWEAVFMDMTQMPTAE
jgi:predicted lactoylglutathione lyase